MKSHTLGNPHRSQNYITYTPKTRWDAEGRHRGREDMERMKCLTE